MPKLCPMFLLLLRNSVENLSQNQAMFHGEDLIPGDGMSAFEERGAVSQKEELQQRHVVHGTAVFLNEIGRRLNGLFLIELKLNGHKGSFADNKCSSKFKKMIRTLEQPYTKLIRLKPDSRW